MSSPDAFRGPLVRTEVVGADGRVTGFWVHSSADSESCEAVEEFETREYPIGPAQFLVERVITGS